MVRLQRVRGRARSWRGSHPGGWAGTASAALAATALAGPAGATVAGTNGQIAFARQLPTGGTDVFIANPDGTQVQQVPLVYPAEDFGIPRRDAAAPAKSTGK